MRAGLGDGDLDRAAATFRLLGDASRLAILRCLLAGGEASVGQLVSATGRGQANVSKHLKRLAAGGLLARRRGGSQVFYRLTDLVVAQACRLLIDGPPAGPGA